MKTVSTLLGMVAGVALTLGVVAGGSAIFAQQAEPGMSGSPIALAGPRGHDGARGWMDDAAFDELFAKELGITVERLQEARSAARAGALEQAVADGSLTQAQADLIQAREALKDAIDHKAILAEALGMSVAELDEATAAGQRLPEIIEAQGLDAATVQAAIKKGHEAAVQAAVSNGTITQEQADQLLSETGRGPGGHHGLFGGHGGRGPRGGIQVSPSSIVPDSDT